ncbi:MAG: dTDP-4-dehydrorhamnose 3,5-epimerase family protein [Paracoccus sp. (in: a-proteobacteria)]|uniref:dTDP-4-dehydrorhamnose 3,5-epimerase family protein n=1 Tax=Paracoccus sp. TaxID=267 RepID=UPI0026DF10A3|nr:dTDP-4-dehydrorhamnose 3,5-epimerase family protein [Paracoccus sp. (in: a-proteobacteria)]MDO5621282.1 dTDP-4-dehydrorhamnose 3,5-epimerase family protein [Paracoccus sp. (in: a-proteobacteria)]
MQLTPTPIPGLFSVESSAHSDERGSFRRAWCADAFAQAGLDFTPHQASISTNIHLHTLRGMHFQTAPHQEQKLVRCVAGAIHEVALDLRPDSPTFRRFYATQLSADQGNALFLPRGLAHGFLTLTPGAVVEYLIDTAYAPEAASGVRWNDPAFGIDWPAAPQVINPRDAAWPDFPRD